MSTSPRPRCRITASVTRSSNAPGRRCFRFSSATAPRNSSATEQREDVDIPIGAASRTRTPRRRARRSLRAPATAASAPAPTRGTESSRAARSPPPRSTDRSGSDGCSPQSDRSSRTATDPAAGGATPRSACRSSRRSLAVGWSPTAANELLEPRVGRRRAVALGLGQLAERALDLCEALVASARPVIAAITATRSCSPLPACAQRLDHRLLPLLGCGLARASTTSAAFPQPT